MDTDAHTDVQNPAPIMTTTNLICSQHCTVCQFMLQLASSTISGVESKIDKTPIDYLLRMLASITDHIRTGSIDQMLMTENFGHLLSHALAWERVSTRPEFLVHVRNVVRLMHSNFPERIGSLLKSNVAERIVIILQKELETGKAVEYVIGNSFVFTVNHLMSEFLPSQTMCDRYKDLRRLAYGILSAGPRQVGITPLGEYNILMFVRVVLPTVLELCRKSDHSLEHLTLLLKIQAWFVHKNLEELVSIEELLELIKLLLISGSRNRIKFGLLMTNVLMSKHLMTMYRVKLHLTLIEIQTEVDEILDDDYDEYQWVREIYGSLAVHVLHIPEFDRRPLSNEEIDSKTAFIRTQLENVLEIFNGAAGDVDEKSRYLRLVVEVACTMHDGSKSSFAGETDRLALSRNLEAQVFFATDVLDAMLDNAGHFDYVPDMQRPTWMGDPAVSCLNYSPAILRAVGPSRCPDELKENRFVQVLRYLSILYAVNDEWKTVFELGKPTPLIDRCHFHSEVMTDFFSSLTEEEGTVRTAKLLFKIARAYPFLIPVDLRERLLRLRLSEEGVCYADEKKAIFQVARRKVVDIMVNDLSVFCAYKKFAWNFTFHGEEASGPGPTKEFYTEFSRDCQRHELGLWMGEPSEEIDGLRYTMAEGGGLFPSPDGGNSAQKVKTFYALGVVMAKSMTDGQQLDFNFSGTFFKLLFASNLHNPSFAPDDLRDIAPSLQNFLKDLTCAVSEKMKIESDHSLTEEEKSEAVASIECGGASFEDLCIVFTVPGYPHLEMKQGGKDVLLTIDNVEEYLQLTIWWLLQFGPHSNLSMIKAGFESVLPTKYLKIFYSYEFQSLFSGDEDQNWTKKMLKHHCILEDGLTTNTPVIRNLFKVLSSLSVDERKQFLLFVTSRPRLPVGGLCFLTPPLTIRRQQTFGNPDLYLPTARTCFNTLCIAEYSTETALRQKLLTAFAEGGSAFHFV